MRPPRRARRPRPTQVTRPVAPDDDPEFLGKIGPDPYDRLLEQWEEELRRGSGDNDGKGDQGPDPDGGNPGGSGPDADPGDRPAP